MHVDIKPLGDRALIVAFESRVDPAINARVLAAAAAIEAAALPGVTDVVPALCTVGVHYRPEVVAAAAATAADRQSGSRPAWRSPQGWLGERLRAIVAALPQAGDVAGRIIEIPVVYGGEHGPDLPAVAARCGLSPDEVVARHLASPHRVFMLGFSPGLPFIGGLDPALALPRRDTPRTRVPARTVAIAREQTIIYSFETPGGWHLIGRTPLELFEAAAEPPCRLSPGDRIRFTAITADAYRSIRESAAAHVGRAVRDGPDGGPPGDPAEGARR